MDNRLIATIGHQQVVLINAPEEAYKGIYMGCDPKNHLPGVPEDGLYRIVLLNGRTIAECAYCGASEDLT